MSNIHTPTDQVLSKCADSGTLVTGSSLGVDTKGFTRAKVVFALTTGATASTFDASIQESNDNGVSDPYTLVIGSNIATVPAASSHAIRTISVNLDHRKRFLKISEAVSGTVAGSIVFELFNPELAPVTQDISPILV